MEQPVDTAKPERRFGAKSMLGALLVRRRPEDEIIATRLLAAAKAITKGTTKATAAGFLLWFATDAWGWFKEQAKVQRADNSNGINKLVAALEKNTEVQAQAIVAQSQEAARQAEFRGAMYKIWGEKPPKAETYRPKPEKASK